MSKSSSLFVCPVCKGKTKVQFKKPGLIVPIVVRYVCGDCDSKITSLVRRARGEPCQINFVVTEFVASDEAMKIIEQAAKAQEAARKLESQLVKDATNESK